MSSWKQVLIRLKPDEYEDVRQKAVNRGLTIPSLAKGLLTESSSLNEIIETRLNEVEQKLDDVVKAKKKMDEGILEAISRAIRACVTTEELAKIILKENDYESYKKRIDERMNQIIRR